MWNIGAIHPKCINQIYLINVSFNVPSHSEHSLSFLSLYLAHSTDHFDVYCT